MARQRDRESTKLERNLLKEAQMKKTLTGFVGLVFLLSVFVLVAAPARAQSVDDKIKNLEQELSDLKSQQIEMKKDAAAAAAALPNFTYRPANGALIEAADKSWGLRFSLESHFRLEFESGRAQAGRSHGEIFGRRFRPYINYCINDCLYETEMGLDLDGWGTGNGKNATNTATSSILQRGVVYVHFERLNPWLPRLEFGMDMTGIGVFPYRQGNNNVVAAQGEYDVLSRNNGFNTGRAGQGFLLTWNDIQLSPIGIPGRARFQFARASIGEADDGLQSFKDTSNYNTGIQIEPFTALKNKWLSGLGFSFNAFFCNNVTTNTNVSTVTTPDYGCSRNRIQDDGDGGRQTLFDSGTISGRGMNVYLSPGMSWKVGPYQIYGVMGFEHFGANQEINTGHVYNKARNFLIGHELWLWSPKGFLTGNANDTGSVLFGTHFERVDTWCDRPNGAANCAAGGQFSRERALVREWDLWYFIAPQASIGVNWQWWNASNLRTGFGQAGDNLGVCDGRVAHPCQYKSWHTVWLNWRMNF